MQPIHDYVHRKFGKVYITIQAWAVEITICCRKRMWILYNSHARQDLEQKCIFYLNQNLGTFGI